MTDAFFMCAEAGGAGVLKWQAKSVAGEVGVEAGAWWLGWRFSSDAERVAHLFALYEEMTRR